MIKNILEKTWCAFMAAILIWCMISYTEILYKNLQPNPQYSAYNALVLLTNIK